MPEHNRQTQLVERARNGDESAFGRLVHEFQDMAVGYAVSQLGDLHEAEDAAQDAFVAAFQQLPNLRQAITFPAWLRTLVRTACSRRTRRWQPDTTSLELTPEPGTDPAPDLEGTAMDVMRGLWTLPETERAVVALTYISGYSYRDIAGFLGIPLTTVQGRLRTGRNRLKERMWQMAEEELGRNAPSKSSHFQERVRRLVLPADLETDAAQPWSGGAKGTDVWSMITACIEGDLDKVRRLVEQDARLATCEQQYRTPLHFATQEGHLNVVNFLLEHGANPTYRSGNTWHVTPLTIAEERGHTDVLKALQNHAARSGVAEGGERIAETIRSRDVDAVRELLDAEPDLLTAGDGRGNSAIHWAVMIRSIPMIDLVLERGADINAMRPDGARPIHLTNGDYYFRGRREVPDHALTTHEILIGYLIARGADYNIAMAAQLGDTERVAALLQQDPSLANAVPDYVTYSTGMPLHNACKANDMPTVRALLDAGADPSTPEPGIAPQGGALYAAARQENVELARMLLERGADPNAVIESSGNCMGAAGTNVEMLRLLASYGGEFRPYRDLSDLPQEALEAVYGDALPLRYYVDIGDVDELIRRMDAEPEVSIEVLRRALPGELSRKHIVRLCLDRDPSLAKQIHANELIYSMRSTGEEPMLEIFEWLLEAGMTPNDSDWLRVSSLHILALGKIAHGTDGSQYTAHTNVLRMFIEAGGDMQARDEEFQSTPLGWAARWGRVEAAELLLERGSPTNLPDDQPWATPLAWARQKGHAEVERMLLEAGATE